MYIHEDGETVECAVEHAHNTIPGKLKHVDDIGRNEAAFNAAKEGDEFKRRVNMYREFIKASEPEK